MASAAGKRRSKRPAATKHDAEAAGDGDGTGACAMDEDPTHALPPGWEQLQSPSGQVYYEDPHRKRTQWVHPFNEPLPRDWRVQVTASGQPYYLNDQTKETQWDHPCKVVGEALVLDAPPPVADPEWEVDLGNGGWFPFNAAANKQVALAIRAGETQVNIGNNRVVDVNKMVQVRTDTRMVRKVRLRSGSLSHLTAGGAAAAAAPMDVDPVPASTIKWEVKTDQGWKRYGPKEEASLSQSYATNTVAVDVYSRGCYYVVNLARFTQRRGDIKSVVRQVRASDIKTKAAVDPLLDKPLSWQVHTDKGWVEYQADVADAISVAHARKLPTVGITVSPAHSYVVDLGKMTQTPVNGGKSRKIRGPFST